MMAGLTVRDGRCPACHPAHVGAADHGRRDPGRRRPGGRVLELRRTPRLGGAARVRPGRPRWSATSSPSCLPASVSPGSCGRACCGGLIIHLVQIVFWVVMALLASLVFGGRHLGAASQRCSEGSLLRAACQHGRELISEDLSPSRGPRSSTGQSRPLITVWLQVRVLPGPPVSLTRSRNAARDQRRPLRCRRQGVMGSTRSGTSISSKTMAVQALASGSPANNPSIPAGPTRWSKAWNGGGFGAGHVAYCGRKAPPLPAAEWRECGVRR